MRWNKLVGLALAVAIGIVVLAGCTSNASEPKSKHYFVLVSQSGTCEIVYESTTKVMYVVSESPNNKGIFTLLVNADGTPMVYEGEG